MSKAPYIIAQGINLLLLGAIPVVQYFAERKLGMARWLNFNRQQLDNVLSLDTFKYVLLAAICIVSLVAFWRAWKRRFEFDTPQKLSLGFSCIVLVAYAVTTFVLSHSITRAAFLIVGILALASLIQCALMFGLANTAHASGQPA